MNKRDFKPPNPQKKPSKPANTRPRSTLQTPSRKMNQQDPKRPIQCVSPLQYQQINVPPSTQPLSLCRTNSMADARCASSHQCPSTLPMTLPNANATTVYRSRSHPCSATIPSKMYAEYPHQSSAPIKMPLALSPSPSPIAQRITNPT